MAQEILEPEADVCPKRHEMVCEDCPFFEDCLLGRRRLCEWRNELNELNFF